MKFGKFLYFSRQLLLEGEKFGKIPKLEVEKIFSQNPKMKVQKFFDQSNGLSRTKIKKTWTIRSRWKFSILVQNAKITVKSSSPTVRRQLKIQSWRNLISRGFQLLKFTVESKNEPQNILRPAKRPC